MITDSKQEINAWKIAESKRISELSLFDIIGEITDYETGLIEDTIQTRFTQKKLDKMYAKKAYLL